MKTSSTFKGLKSQGGYTILTVLIAASISLLVYLQIAYQMQHISTTVNYIDAKSFMAGKSMQMQIYQSNEDLWLEALRETSFTSSVFSTCLPESGNTFSCPAHDGSLANDPYLSTIIPVGWTNPGISTIPLVELSGRNLAGPVGQEIFYTKTGQECSGGASDVVCNFVATGYMIRENQANNVDPGGVILALRIEQTPITRSREINIRPYFAEVYMIADPINCPAGFTLIDTAGIQGCMQNNEDNAGHKNHGTAILDCLQKYGGRLPTQTEWVTAATNYGGSLNNLTDDFEWTGTQNGTDRVACGQGTVSNCQAFGTGSNYPFRCWVDP